MGAGSWDSATNASMPRAWFGAIAQLGERVLCKHEVVGSIPSGSTILLCAGDSAARSWPPVRPRIKSVFEETTVPL